MPTVYRNLGRTLADRVEAFLEAPHFDQVSLYEELALSRVSAEESIKLFEAAMQSQDVGTRHLAQDILNGALQRVQDMVLAVSRLEQASDDRVTIKVVDMFIARIVKCIYRVLQGDEALAAKIASAIREEVPLPMDNRRVPGAMAGTALTPDLMVTEMDRMSAHQMPKEPS